jgi:hypothetical protein
MPSECPRHTVTAVVARKSTNAPHVKKIGPPTRATNVMPEIHSDFTGFQCTLPAAASVASASNMRGERKVLSDLDSASSTGSNDPADMCPAPAATSITAPSAAASSLKPTHPRAIARASRSPLFRGERDHATMLGSRPFIAH